MKKFWNFIRNDAGERILRLEGPIDEDSFWGDEVTPRMFREELEAEEGDVTVWICSPGGNVFAAAEIYTMLCDHKGKVTVKIDSIAASAASVVAMAGDRVLMSPVAMLMIHDPMTIAMGNAKDMEKAISTLNEVKASIINAYQKKTGLSRGKISQLMENETWMNAKKAVELGFADEILFARNASGTEESEEEKDDGKEIEAVWQPYSTRVMGQIMLGRLGCTPEAHAGQDEEPGETGSDTEGVEAPEAGVKPVPQADTISGKDAISEADTPADGKARQETDIPAPSAESGKNKPEDDDPDEDDPEDDPDRDDSEDDPNGDDSENDPEEDDPDEEGGDDPEKPRKPAENREDVSADDEKPPAPVIGMDGKTKDGAMPYELLKKQLDFLK